MEDWVKVAIGQWQAEHLHINAGTSLTSIINAENYLGFIFPDDFKQLYIVANAFEDYEWRPNMFSLWSIERIVAEYDETANDDFISFCDFLICSSFLGFLKTSTGIFKRYSIADTPTDFVTSSFQEAVRLINEDSELIY